MKAIHDILLWIHIPAGTISLILFWIPVMVTKGGNIHRKAGKAYYYSMWIVLITSVLLSINNLLMSQWINATFLGYLAVLTGYPLWYSYEILQQRTTWTPQYYTRRKIFAGLLFSCAIGMLVAAAWLRFEGFGILMLVFGLLGLPAIKDVLADLQKAMSHETRIQTHIRGTIISGIAAYTAFLSFGGRSLFGDLLPGYWQVLPWVMPTLVGLPIIRVMKKRYAKRKKNGNG